VLNLSRDICDLLESRASSGRSAFEYVKTLFTQIITTLRRDPRFAEMTLFELELLLANQPSEAEKILFSEMRDRVRLDDAEDAVRLCLGNDYGEELVP
jgi:hypothetical protein